MCNICSQSRSFDTYADSSLAGRKLTPKLEVPIMQENLLVCGVLGRDAMRMVQYQCSSVVLQKPPYRVHLRLPGEHHAAPCVRQHSSHGCPPRNYHWGSDEKARYYLT
ncbi:hypothetical protein TNCT_605411 [Trichonephila clavata]|uniref:Uncharacterized protein n=1 Tax=Trichonephila clavata TaxID=2740835 RepID=A0A8X6FZJ1_TRICU|nr:hypothetical protein TNCT_605411 [Trichonephila clavata]